MRIAVCFSTNKTKKVLQMLDNSPSLARVFNTYCQKFLTPPMLLSLYKIGQGAPACAALWIR